MFSVFVPISIKTCILVDFDADIYITGSNARLLSSELATYLAGRYIEIPKFVVTMDAFWQENVESVRHFYIADFLLSKEY